MHEKPSQRLIAAVLVLALAIPLAWVGYSANWIRQRHAFMTSADREQRPIARFQGGKAPPSLTILGEHGYRLIYVPKSMDDSVAERAAELFPEATITRDRFLAYRSIGT